MVKVAVVWVYSTVFALSREAEGVLQDIVLIGAAGTAVLFISAKMLWPLVQLGRKVSRGMDALVDLAEWKDDVDEWREDVDDRLVTVERTRAPRPTDSPATA